MRTLECYRCKTRKKVCLPVIVLRLRKQKFKFFCCRVVAFSAPASGVDARASPSCVERARDGVSSMFRHTRGKSSTTRATTMCGPAYTRC